MAGGLGARWAEGAPVRLPTGTTVPHQDLHWLDATIGELQALMRSGELTSSELTQRYLQRIDRLNPTLHAVLETTPQALRIAAQRDRERRRGITYGPLHGIPILVKDNIATDDRMETTAGSLALVGSRVPADAQLVANLRTSGAVILGKANLSEWANFRGDPPADFPFETNFLNGWSGRGGFSLNPYVLNFDPGGPSSGSATGVVLYAGYLQEPKLLSIAYGIEQLLEAHSRPQFLAAPPPEPPDAGICSAGAGAAAAPLTPRERAAAIRRRHGVMPMSRGMAPHR